MKIRTALFGIFVLALVSCEDTQKSDAYGNFEATTITISANGTGQLILLNVEEGQKIENGALVGLIDTTQLYLQKLKVEAQLKSLQAKLKEAEPEIAVLEEKYINLIRERDRTERLVNDKAATQKQLDDLNGEIDVVQKQKTAVERQTSIVNRGIMSEREPMLAQLVIIENAIDEHMTYNPIDGTVLTKYAEPNELVGMGSPLYKIADLRIMKLRAYSSARLLGSRHVGDEVTVLVDDGERGLKEMQGKITWISEEAEFTPKTIETREERVNLVYALEVSVNNDGGLKIGMPGEVVFSAP